MQRNTPIDQYDYAAIRRAAVRERSIALREAFARVFRRPSDRDMLDI